MNARSLLNPGWAGLSLSCLVDLVDLVTLPLTISHPLLFLWARRRFGESLPTHMAP